MPPSPSLLWGESLHTSIEVPNLPLHPIIQVMEDDETLYPSVVNTTWKVLSLSVWDENSRRGPTWHKGAGRGKRPQKPY
jgi:hypothetical protein